MATIPFKFVKHNLFRILIIEIPTCKSHAKDAPTDLPSLLFGILPSRHGVVLSFIASITGEP